MKKIPPNPQSKPLVILLTGMSGAGRTSALGFFEDHGFYVIDNLPNIFLRETFQMISTGKLSTQIRGYVFAIRIFDNLHSDEIIELMNRFKNDFQLDLIFLDSKKESLKKRYNATRRKHPFHVYGIGDDVEDSIDKESKILSKLKKNANHVYDTSDWSPQVLARQIESTYSTHLPKRKLIVTITSFGFKYGRLKDADNVFDVRFLDNPYFQPALKSKSGQTPEVKNFFDQSEQTQNFLKKLKDWYDFILPQYVHEGKRYLNIGVGCTGGFHRSVFVSQSLRDHLISKNSETYDIEMIHRDLSHAVEGGH